MLTDSSLFRMLFTNTEQTYKPKFRLFSTFRCAVRDFLATYSLQCLPNHPQKLFTERAIACDCLQQHYGTLRTRAHHVKSLVVLLRTGLLEWPPPIAPLIDSQCETEW